MDITIEARERFHAPADIAFVFAVLSDVPRSVSHYPDVESLEDLGDGVYHWKLRKLGTAGISHQIEYACRYVSDESAGVVRWTPVAGVGNCVIEGEWTLSADSAGTQVTFANTGTLSIPVPRLLRSAAAPFVRSAFSGQMATYLANLRATFAAPPAG